MKKKIKISLILSLAIIFGCFSNVFAASNQNNKIKKIAEVKKSVRLLDNTNDNGVDQYTKLLMHMDNDGFKDECSHNITNTGVALDTNNKRFGTGSASFDGSNSYFIGQAGISDYDLHDQDGTIECWVYPVNLSSGEQAILDYGPSGAGAVFRGYSLMLCNNQLEVVFNKEYDMQYSFNNNQWYHIEIDLKGTTLYAFVNGKLIQSISGVTAPTVGPTDKLGIGGFNGKKQDGTPERCWFQGNIDELKISVGVVRHTSDFTPYGIDDGISLNKTTDTLTLGNIGNTDTLIAKVTPDNAINKTVKWTSSNSDIVRVDQNGNIIAQGKGTAIITATTTDGSNLSTTCTVTVAEPTNPTDSSDKAILNITMTNGQVKQYNVTMDTVNKFIAWYRLRSAGSGDPLYEFNITQTSNPSIVKTDYVVFDKISSFEVDDYTK